MAELLEGGCLCGAVRYRLDRKITDAGYCHCRMCQQSSGAPVLAWVTVPVEAFQYIKGTVSVYRSSAKYQREFCGNCGAQILFRKSADPAAVDITIASLDDPESVKPEYHIWTMSRIPWFETDDALPRHEGPNSEEDD